MTEPAHHKRESRGSPRGFEPGQHRPISLLAGLVALVLADTAIAGDGVPELPRWSFGYDDQDRLGTIGTPEGGRLTFGRGPDGKITSITDGQATRAFTHDREGRLAGVTDPTGTTRLTSDGHGRLSRMTYPQGDSVVYAYGEAGRIAAVTWGDRHFLRTTRDLFGNIVALDTPAGRFRIDYDYDGRRMKRTYPNGAISTFEYNDDGRATLIRHAGPDGGLVLRLAYAYTDEGLLAHAREASPARDLEITYAYDAHGQLLSAVYSDGRRYAYAYDSFGNRVRASGPDGDSTAAYDHIDRLVAFNGRPVAHDAAGRVTALEDARFSYDGFGDLVSDGTHRYATNGLGLRVAVGGPTGTARHRHLIDDLPYLLAEIGDTTTRYIWSDGRVLGQIDADDHAVFFFEDQLGSIRAAIDDAGSVIGHADYAPFGEPNSRIAGVRFGFAGQEQSHTGMVYLSDRYYAPRAGRFLSKDAVFPNPIAPSQENTYAYVSNSPTNFVDASGKYKEALYYPFGNPYDYYRVIQDSRQAYA